MADDSIFQRVKTAYDLEHLKRCRVIYVGTGGAASFIEDMVRAGVGEHILIDPDVVTATNIATQQTYTVDIGKPKVECIANRIKSINPAARIHTFQSAIEDISDEEFSAIAFDPYVYLTNDAYSVSAPKITLICGLTDNFYAQARVGRLSLKYSIPTLCAQLYQFGHAAEITFTYPSVTPACQRCILSPRYKMYLEQGYQNMVTSDGAPIFATTRVNALKGMIAMALLHHGTTHPTWGNILSRIGNRTLVQIRIHPDTQLSIFNKVLESADTSRLFFDEAVWLPQEANPSCPECGETGDLHKA